MNCTKHINHEYRAVCNCTPMAAASWSGLPIVPSRVVHVSRNWEPEVSLWNLRVPVVALGDGSVFDVPVWFGCFLSPFDASRPLHLCCNTFRLKGGYRFSSLPIPWVRYAHVESRETVVHCKRRPWARVTRRVGPCFLATANALDLEPSLVAIDVLPLVEEGHSLSGGTTRRAR
jgi:hypothetical protein